MFYSVIIEENKERIRKMLTRKEIAKELNVSLPTLDLLRKKGLPELKVGKVVRFNKEDVFKWFKERSEKEKEMNNGK